VVKKKKHRIDQNLQNFWHTADFSFSANLETILKNTVEYKLSIYLFRVLILQKQNIISTESYIEPNT